MEKLPFTAEEVEVKKALEAKGSGPFATAERRVFEVCVHGLFCLYAT